MEYLTEVYGFTNFRIMDDTFASNKKRVFAFCEEIKKRGLKLNLTCLTHVKTAEENMFKAMKDAGFTIVAFGIESGNDQILKQINKKITRESAIHAIHCAQNAGLLVEGLFMIGNMGETRETIEETIAFAKTYNPVFRGGQRSGFNWFQFATPFPGSRFYEKAAQYGTIVSTDFDDYTHQTPVFLPHGLDSETMVRLRERALKENGHNRPPSETGIGPQSQIPVKQNRHRDPLTVLHVGWGHPPNMSAGPIYYLHHLCREQRAWGMNVFCFVASNDQGDASKIPKLTPALLEDIPYYIIGNRPAHYFDWPNPRRETENPVIKSLFREVLQNLHPDIVHFHNLVGLSMSLPELAKQSGAATIFSAHNYWMICPRDDLFAPNEVPCTGPGDGARCAGCVGYPEHLADFMFRASKSKRILEESMDVIMAVSDRVKGIVSGFGVDPEKIVTSHIGSVAAAENWRIVGEMRRAENSFADRPVVFGYFGTITARKGVHVILEAVKHLRKREGQFTVAIHGYCPPGPYNQRLNLIMESDSFLKRYIQFKGGYQQFEIPGLSRAIDMAIIPPVWEDNGPQTVLETLGAGLPVLGADIGGIPDFIKEKENGLLFRPGDGRDLARAMGTVIEDRTLIPIMRRKISAPITMDRHVIQLSKIYRQLLENRVQGHPVFSSTHRGDDEANRRYQAIQTMIAEDRMEEVFQELRRLVDDFSGCAAAHNDLGVLLFARGQTVEALAHCRLAVEQDPGNVTFLKNLADILYVGFKNTDEALSIYLALMKRVPSDIEVLSILGRISIELNHLETAKSLYRRIVQLQPDNQEARQSLSALLRVYMDREGSRMKQDWDKRAEENARYYIHSTEMNQTDEAFDASGKNHVQNLVVDDLQTLVGDFDPKNLIVLEIGCGIGRMTRYLAEVFKEIHGVDISGNMIQKAKSRLEGVSNAYCYETNGTDLSVFPNEIFHLVFSFIVFQHIPSKKVIMNYLREVHRVLKTGGVFKFQVQGCTDPNWMETEKDTWHGVTVTEEDITGISQELGYDFLAKTGQGTQVLLVYD